MSRDQNLKIGISRERKKILSWNFGKIFVITRQLIWAVKIISSCYGSRAIPILNIDHVTTRSRDFFKFFKPFLGMCSMGLHKACTINWPYILWFSHNKAPQFDLRYVCIMYVYMNHGKFHSLTVNKRKIVRLQKFVWKVISTEGTIVQILETKVQL